jgi:hypothetical protein
VIDRTHDDEGSRRCGLAASRRLGVGRPVRLTSIEPSTQGAFWRIRER